MWWCVDSKVGDSNHIPGLKMQGNLTWIMDYIDKGIIKSVVKNFEMSVLKCPIYWQFALQMHLTKLCVMRMCNAVGLSRLCSFVI